MSTKKYEEGHIAAEALDEYIATQDDDHQAGKDGKFHPSSMWMCDRQAVMTARGEPITNPPSAKNHRVFLIGNIIHEAIQDALRQKYGENFEAEQSIGGRLLAGHSDGLQETEEHWVEERDNGDYRVWEFKSTRSLANQRKQGGPSEHHVKQAATYAVAFKRDGYNVTEVRIVYFEKTNLDILEFVVPYDPKWEQMVDDKIEELEPYLESPGQYPACNGPEWLHSYCPYYPSCKKSTKAGGFTW